LLVFYRVCLAGNSGLYTAREFRLRSSAKRNRARCGFPTSAVPLSAFWWCWDRSSYRNRDKIRTNLNVPGTPDAIALLRNSS